MVNHMRHTRSQTNQRRSHSALTETRVSFCSKCGAAKQNHTVCLNCGTYNGRVVVDVNAALAKKEKKIKARAAAAK